MFSDRKGFKDKKNFVYGLKNIIKREVDWELDLAYHILSFPIFCITKLFVIQYIIYILMIESRLH